MNIETFLSSYIPEPPPNKLTISMGSLIRSARKEANITQQYLSYSVSISQSRLSRLEKGISEITSSDLIKLSIVLNKPITYFFPQPILRNLNKDINSDPLIKELLSFGGQLDNLELKKIIAQIRAILELNNHS